MAAILSRPQCVNLYKHGAGTLSVVLFIKYAHCFFYWLVFFVQFIPWNMDTVFMYFESESESEITYSTNLQGIHDMITHVHAK